MLNRPPYRVLNCGYNVCVDSGKKLLDFRSQDPTSLRNIVISKLKIYIIMQIFIHNTQISLHIHYLNLRSIYLHISRLEMLFLPDSVNIIYCMKRRTGYNTF